MKLLFLLMALSNPSLESSEPYKFGGCSTDTDCEICYDPYMAAVADCAKLSDLSLVARCKEAARLGRSECSGIPVEDLERMN